MSNPGATSEVPVAYLAGVLDANGIFRIRETDGGTKLAAIFVHGVPIPILDLLSKYSGTKVSVVKRDYPRSPCLEHCDIPHQHIVSVSGRWSVTGAKATVMISAILPHLIFQRDAAEEVLAVGLEAPRKKSSYAKMSAFGWPIPEA